MESVPNQGAPHKVVLVGTLSWRRRRVDTNYVAVPRHNPPTMSQQTFLSGGEKPAEEGLLRRRVTVSVVLDAAVF